MTNADEELSLEYLLSPEFEMINSAGKPLTDGFIECYVHGTRDKYYCYSDWAGTLHPFQIPLDSLGANVVLADPGQTYDVYVYNKFGSLIMSRYNVKCQSGGGTSTVEYLGDRLEYGQYTARDVTTVARLLRQKGNINTTQDGFLKLKEDMSYHITVRGTFVCDHLDNVATSLNYIEYSSFNPIKVNIDETVSGEQHFELSYDIFRLPNDMDYQVGFDASNGHISSLAVEVHSLSNLNTTLQGGGDLFEQGWGIIIDNNVISVDPSIFEEYPTFDDLQAAVTGVHETITNETLELVSSVSSVLQDEIDNIQQGVQSDWEQDDPSEPDYIKNKPDLSEFATHDEVISTVSSVSSTLQNEIDELPRPVNADWEATSGLAEILNKPDLDIYATKGEVSTATSTIENEITEVVNTVCAVSSVLDNKIDTVETEIVNTVCAVSSVLQEEIDNIPEQVQSDWEQNDYTQKDYIKNKPDLDIYATKDELNVATGDIVNTVCAVSSVLQDEIDNIPEQVQSDWNEDDPDSPAYIQNKPDLDIYATHDEVSGVSAVLKEIIDEVSAAVPDAQVQSDWTETDDTKKSYIQHKPEVKDVYAGENIILTDTASGLEISAVGTDTETVSAIAQEYAVQSDWTQTDDTQKDYIKNKPTPKTLVAGQNIVITDTVTGLEISSTGGGSAQVNSDWNAVSGVAEILNKPEEVNLVAGQNISIAVTGASAIISSTGGGGGSSYTPGTGIDITNDVISVNSDVALASAIPELPDEEEVDFKEIDLDDYALASTVPTIELNGDSQVTAIDGHTLAGGGGATYTAGTGVEIDANNVISVSGVAMTSDLPTTEVGKFTIQSNVSGGPIEVICPTDQAPDTVVYQINSVTGTAYSSGRDYSVINYYYGETPADFNGSADAILFTINDTISNISNIQFYYTTGAAGIGGPSLSTTSISGGDTGIVQSGTYKVKAQYNQAGTSSSYGKYLQIMFGWKSYASDVAEATEWAQEAISKITFFGVVRPDPSLGATVNLDRYYLSNAVNSSTLSNELACQLNIDEVSKKQKVYLPGSAPSSWNLKTALFFQYGSSSFGYSNADTSHDYIAYKYNSTTRNYEFAELVNTDYNAKKFTFARTYNGAIEYWIADCTNGYYNAVWSTETNSYATEAEIQAVSAAIPDVSNLATKTELATVEANVQTVSAAIPELPDDEEVEFVELDLADYAPASAIPDTSDMATQTWVGQQGYLTSVPSNYVTDTELNGAVSGFATKTEVNTGLADKQNTLTGITDVQVVQTLPVSPVLTVLYLIPEA